jgi:putative chitinase
LLLTDKQLNYICPALKGAYLTKIVNVINKVAPLYKMDNYDILEELIPNLLVECMEFTKFGESLNYSINGLLNTFSRSRISLADCNKYGRIDGKRAADQVAIGNIIYGGDFGRKNLGNTLPTDGYLLRGSGEIQLTGYSNIKAFADYYNKRFGTNYTVYQMADMLRDKFNLEMGMHSAFWFFSIAKGLIPLAINDQFKQIVLKINGGYNALEQRTTYYNRAKTILK